jgi:hypothetical protein
LTVTATLISSSYILVISIPPDILWEKGVSQIRPGTAEKCLNAGLEAVTTRSAEGSYTNRIAATVGDLVLSRSQPLSKAAKGVTSKFMRPYEGPWRITKIIPSSYEISSSSGKVRGVFHKQALKPYQTV